MLVIKTPWNLWSYMIFNQHPEREDIIALSFLRNCIQKNFQFLLNMTMVNTLLWGFIYLFHSLCRHCTKIQQLETWKRGRRKRTQISAPPNPPPHTHTHTHTHTHIPLLLFTNSCKFEEASGLAQAHLLTRSALVYSNLNFKGNAHHLSQLGAGQLACSMFPHENHGVSICM